MVWSFGCFIVLLYGSVVVFVKNDFGQFDMGQSFLGRNECGCGLCQVVVDDFFVVQRYFDFVLYVQCVLVVDVVD